MKTSDENQVKSKNTKREIEKCLEKKIIHYMFTAVRDACTQVEGVCGTTTHMACRDDGQGLKCLCITGYTGNTGDAACQLIGKDSFVLVCGPH